MSVPIIVSCQLDAADDNGIAETQTPAGAGDLDLDGILVVDGVAILTDPGMARQVLITTADDETGKTITIYGTNATGNPVSETIAAPNATTATSVAYYQTITRIAVSAAFAGAVIVGTNGVGSSRIVALNMHVSPVNFSVAILVSGTVNCDIEYTYQDPNKPQFDSGGQLPTTNPEADLVWFDDANLTGETGNAAGSVTYPVWGARLKMNSGTGTATAHFIQAGIRGN